ncbi:MAG: GIY-YIG nuclease family protein [Peptostreptococcaceae bacterium]|nr:GIY-YIG nuclease family protein [Peptostreptococcaceae bacterium]
MQKITGIYQIQSESKPWKFYIGSSVDIHRRWRRHQYELLAGKHPNIHMLRHFKKYGELDFRFSILHVCMPHQLIEMEQRYITTFTPTFNMLPAASSRLGYKATADTIKRQVSAWKNRSPISMFSRLFKKSPD